jgi:hypothetical protein
VSFKELDEEAIIDSELLQKISDLGRARFRSVFLDETRQLQVIVIVASLLAAGAISQIFSITEIKVVNVVTKIDTHSLRNLLPRITISVFLIYLALLFSARAIGDLHNTNLTNLALDGQLADLLTDLNSRLLANSERVSEKRDAFTACLQQWPDGRISSREIRRIIEDDVEGRSLAGIVSTDLERLDRALKTYKSTLMEKCKSSDAKIDEEVQISQMCANAEVTYQQYKDLLEHCDKVAQFHDLLKKEAMSQKRSARRLSNLSTVLEFGGTNLIAGLAAATVALFGS